MATTTKTAKKRSTKVTEAEIVDTTRPIEDIMKDFAPTEVKPTVDVEKVVGKIDVRPTTLRRIDDNGNVSMKGLTKAEVAELVAIGSKLNPSDKMSVMNYGSELSSQLNKSTKELLTLSRTVSIGDETSDIMRDITSKLMKIDLDDIKKPNLFVRTIRKIPVLNKMFFSVEKFLAKYDSLEQQVEKCEEKLEAAQAIALRDNTDLEKRFQNTTAYLQVLEKLILAAKLKSEEFEKAIAVMESTPEKYSAIAIHDAKNFKHELDKRISSMLTWHLSFNQSLFRIRDIQDANIAHSNKISETIENMMPQLRDQLHEAVVLYNMEQGLKAHDVMIDGFNDIIAHNADAAHDMKVRVTERTEKTALKMETLRHNQQRLIDTNKDVLKIMEEAARERANNEREMAKMERELESMLSGQKPTDGETASAIYSKYAIESDLESE